MSYMIDITPGILSHCKEDVDLIALLSSDNTPENMRIQAPYFTVEEGSNQQVPCVALKQQGGGKEFHRFNFLVRGDTPQNAKKIAIMIINNFTKRVTSFKNTDILWVEYRGNIYEYVDSITKYPEVSFTLNFYFQQA